MGDATHMLEENVVAENVNEIAVVSHSSRPMPNVGSSVSTGAISSEVADFFREFEKKTPNPHPEWYFLKFEGSLVSFGDFGVPSDNVPYLQQLIAKHGDFVASFKLGAGFGGPMLSFFSNVLDAMSKFDLRNVTKVQILSWKNVVQYLMEIGFDVGFMVRHLW